MTLKSGDKEIEYNIVEVNTESWETLSKVADELRSVIDLHYFKERFVKLNELRLKYKDFGDLVDEAGLLNKERLKHAIAKVKAGKKMSNENAEQLAEASLRQELGAMMRNNIELFDFQKLTDAKYPASRRGVEVVCANLHSIIVVSDSDKKLVDQKFLDKVSWKEFATIADSFLASLL